MLTIYYLFGIIFLFFRIASYHTFAVKKELIVTNRLSALKNPMKNSSKKKKIPKKKKFSSEEFFIGKK